MEVIDPVEYINYKISSYLLNDTVNQDFGNLIKRHFNKLSEKGDLSFPIVADFWRKSLPAVADQKKWNKNCKNIFDYNYSNNDSCKQVNDFIKHTSNWLFPILNAKIEDNRCIIYFDRLTAGKELLSRVLQGSNHFGTFPKEPCKRIYIQNVEVFEEDTLTLYRMKLLTKVLKNLVSSSEWQLVPKAEDASVKLGIVCPGRKGCDKDFQYIQCGVILDPETKKLATLTYADYKGLRSKDMQLMAMHKYGIRVREQKKFRDLIEQLGSAAVIVDFLEVKHSSPVHLIRNSVGSTKGASFILYNSARIETLLKTFNDGVKQGKYIPLPPIENVDIALLKEEEEWQLLFNYVLPFPNLIKKSLHGLEIGKCAPHLIMQFLSGLVALFSVYYRRVRILMENRSHLVAIVHARIYLVKCIREILNTALAFLGILPVQYM